jgi:tetratricopeptide (TPR) repeat protein
MKLTVLLAIVMAASTVSELTDRLTAARRSWNTDEIVAVQSQVRSDLSGVDTDEAVMLRVRAGLAVAEALRVEFEEEHGDREARRLLGDRIDAYARDALDQIERLPESSERERLRADLLATLIRSDYRAKRLEPELRAAVARALELDPDNPAAHVTAAKPLLFAPQGRGRDIGAALDHLDRALQLDPDLEAALLLRATAREMAGDITGARADARAALDDNPDCAPAARLVERLAEP